MTALPGATNPFDKLVNTHDPEALAQYYAEREKALGPYIERLTKADPNLPYISAYIMAGDLHRADEVYVLLADGAITWEQAQSMTGSYGRMDLRARAFDEGLIGELQAIEGLPHAWSGSDPDDTDPRFLALWRLAFKANRYRTVRDPKGRPIMTDPGMSGTVHVYRGQDKGAPFGIAWSLSKVVATKFAKGAATRQSNRQGVVYEGWVPRKSILGYCVERSESEVILDPLALVGEIGRAHV